MDVRDVDAWRNMHNISTLQGHRSSGLAKYPRFGLDGTFDRSIAV